MLGRLARWLRILGHDVLYFRRIDDADLVDLSIREKRTLLTRDTRLVLRRAARGAILIESPYLEDQLRQMVASGGPQLLAPGLCRRCLVCNEPTAPIKKTEVRGRVPPFVFRTQYRFLRCPVCQRIYWSASHVREILQRLRRTLAYSHFHRVSRTGGAGPGLRLDTPPRVRQPGSMVSAANLAKIGRGRV